MSKKIIRLIFVIVVMSLALTACGEPATPVTTTQPPVEEPLPAAATSQPGGCLGSAETAVVDLNCREVTIAVENAYLPFNYITLETGEPGGWDYEAWREICARLHCVPVFVEVAWDGLIQSVSDGQYDVGASGISITPDRWEIVDFSTGFIQIEQRLLVRLGENRFANIEEFAQNEALVMGTQVGTTNYETAVKFLPEARIKAFEQFPFAIQALIAGDVDAVIIDEIVGMGYQGQNADKLELIGPSISSDELGFAFAKGSPLVDAVNQALEAMKADGSLAALNEKFFSPSFNITEEDIK
ncbi:MAG: ABC transporter substrate-binding protein [Chloroflexota bacterium]